MTFREVVSETFLDLRKEGFVGDIYREVTARVCGIHPDQVTPDQRDIVKYTLYNTWYGVRRV